jgi:hypothetical protein
MLHQLAVLDQAIHDLKDFRGGREEAHIDDAGARAQFPHEQKPNGRDDIHQPLNRVTAEAATALKTLIGEILAALDDLPTDVAERCNKANPAQAIKPLQDWVRKTREAISTNDPFPEDA